MRLILAADETVTPPPRDQWLSYATDGIFSIAPYITAGYTHCDVYVVGGGGGGGGGGGAYQVSGASAGGGGGGGGGAFKQLLNQLLSDLDGTTTVKVGAGGTGGLAANHGLYDGGFGTAGGTSQFGVASDPSGVKAIAYGGGFAEPGRHSSSGTSTGSGGGGGAGGSILETGMPGFYNSQFTQGGLGQHGGGDGGLGGFRSFHTGLNGLNGSAYLDSNNCGGGGGGGGGHGEFAYPNWVNTTMGGNGGKGLNTSGTPQSVSPSTDAKTAHGGGGGGSVDLSALTGHSGLPIAGEGGKGGYGEIFYTHRAQAGFPGTRGFVLVRVYA